MSRIAVTAALRRKRTLAKTLVRLEFRGSRCDKVEHGISQTRLGVEALEEHQPQNYTCFIDGRWPKLFKHIGIADVRPLFEQFESRTKVLSSCIARHGMAFSGSQKKTKPLAQIQCQSHVVGREMLLECENECHLANAQWLMQGSLLRLNRQAACGG
ncbi:hypothetical protein [Rosistilla oblonga]|uniref:hypothetical protein n=1 Tax=Rosistilla oblonga TaxID=2527990 RepID=UPI001E29CA45|nr:hypothetical protein [Rosistilla oblonga]